MDLNPTARRQIDDILRRNGFGDEDTSMGYSSEKSDRPNLCGRCYEQLTYSSEGDKYCIPCLSQDGEAPVGSYCF